MEIMYKTLIVNYSYRVNQTWMETLGSYCRAFDLSFPVLLYMHRLSPATHC